MFHVATKPGATSRTRSSPRRGWAGVTAQDKESPIRRGRNSACPDDEWQAQTRQGKIPKEKGLSGRSRTWPDRAGLDRTGLSLARLGLARQGSARQGKTQKGTE